MGGGRRDAGFGFAEDEEAAGAFAVEAEILGAGIGDHRLTGLGHKGAHAVHVAVKALGEAVIGYVQHDQQALLFRQRPEGFPVVNMRIDPGRVMARPLDDHAVAGFSGRQVCEHAETVEFPVPRVGIFLHVET